MAKKSSKQITKPLTGQERRLIEELSSGASVATAARRANFNLESAAGLLADLSKNPAFKKALDVAKENAASEFIINEGTVMNELASIAFADIIDFYDEKGNLRPLHEIPPHARRAIVGITNKMLGSGEDAEMVTEYKLADKLTALDKLGKKLKLFSDQGGDTNVNLNISYRPTDQLVARFLELVGKARAVGASPGIEAPRINQQIVDVLPE
jgi:phage terminase small subunit